MPLKLSVAVDCSKAVMCVETYSHLSPRGRINNIERDVEKERKEAIAKFKASALHAQSSVAHLGWEFKELTLSCSNKKRSIIKRRCKERLATAKVTWDAAKCKSKSACRAVEKAHEAAVRLAERKQVDGEINSRLAKAKAEEKVARKQCKSALKAAEKAYRTEVGSAKAEQKDGLSEARLDVCKNWDGSESRLERILDNAVSSGHASMQRMESINKRMDSAQTLSLSRRGCSEDEIDEAMEEEMQLCQSVLTDVRRMQLASSSGKAPLVSRSKKDEKTIQRAKAIAEARQKLRILGRYKKDSDTTRARCKRTSKSKGWSSRSGEPGRGRRRKSYPSQGRTCSRGPCCDCCYCFCTRHLESNDRGQMLALSSQVALAQSYFANAAMLTKAEQRMPADSSSLCFTFLAASLFCGSLSFLPTMLADNEMKANPTKTFAALPSATSITLESICMGLVFFAALPLPSGKSFTLERDAPSDVTAAVKAKIEGKEVDVNDSSKFGAMVSKPDAEHTELEEAASQKRLLGGGDEDMDEPRSIFVKLPDSRLITLPFHPLKKISDVKREIECRLRLYPRDYSLYINGGCKRLDKDNLTLSDYGIGKDSTLVINCTSLHGGAGGKRGRPPEDKNKGATSAAEGQKLYRQRLAQAKEKETSRGRKHEADKAEKFTGRWTAEEHRLFLRGLEMHGKDNKKIAAFVKSRNVAQVRTHAQKHFQKLAKKEAGPPPVSLDPFYQARHSAKGVEASEQSSVGVENESPREVPEEDPCGGSQIRWQR